MCILCYIYIYIHLSFSFNNGFFSFTKDLFLIPKKTTGFHVSPWVKTSPGSVQRRTTGAQGTAPLHHLSTKKAPGSLVKGHYPKKSRNTCGAF